MIELHTWSTPNGRKVSIMLEELGLPYSVHPVNIGKDEQFRPEFLAISPNNKIPAIVDPDGPGGKRFALFESGAILIYLGEKTEKLIPKDAATRYVALQWLMFQMGGLGPMLGQTHHFLRAAPEASPMRSSATRTRRGGSTASSTSASPRPSTSPANTRSPTSPPIRGWRATNGTRSSSAISRTSSAGTTPSAPGRRCSAA